jgi:hypothetical protein
MSLGSIDLYAAYRARERRGLAPGEGAHCGNRRTRKAGRSGIVGRTGDGVVRPPESSFGLGAGAAYCTPIRVTDHA